MGNFKVEMVLSSFGSRKSCDFPTVRVSVSIKIIDFEIFCDKNLNFVETVNIPVDHIQTLGPDRFCDIGVHLPMLY